MFNEDLELVSQLNFDEPFPTDRQKNRTKKFSPTRTKKNGSNNSLYNDMDMRKLVGLTIKNSSSSKFLNLTKNYSI